MNSNTLCMVVAFLVLILSPHLYESKKVVIHVPYKVNNVKHTHTIYKIIPHHEMKHEVKSEEYHHEEEDGGYDFYRKR